MEPNAVLQPRPLGETLVAPLQAPRAPAEPAAPLGSVQTMAHFLESDRAWLAALGVALASAQAAAFALRPRDGLIAARAVDPLKHFDAAEMARARRYGRGQLALGAAGAATEASLLVWLVRRERTPVRATATRRGARFAGRRGRSGWSPRAARAFRSRSWSFRCPSAR